MTADELLSKLRGWRDDPSQLDDGDLVPPTREVIEAAIGGPGRWGLVAAVDRLPDRVGPCGEGGISMEWGDSVGGRMVRLAWLNDGTTEGDVFDGGLLVRSSKGRWRESE